MSSAPTFAADFVSCEWPLLLECCSLPRNPAKIAALAGKIRDCESLFRLADEHRVTTHLAAGLASVSDAGIPAALLDSLRSRSRVQLLFNLSMTAELFRILNLLHKSEIATMVIKGPILSLRAYGDPSARQYVDLDLLVRHADIQHAANILMAEGYESSVPAWAIASGKIPGEYFFRRPHNEIIFELHTERTFRFFPRLLPIEKYFQRKTSVPLDGQLVPALSAEHEFVLISIHGAKHFWERLLWVCDVAAIVHNYKELDWSFIRRSAADVCAERMIRVALLLSEKVLGEPIPEEMKDDVARDSACSGLSNQIATWLPYAGYAQ